LEEPDGVFMIKQFEVFVEEKLLRREACSGGAGADVDMGDAFRFEELELGGVGCE
jgi:hypothetical protein